MNAAAGGLPASRTVVSLGRYRAAGVLVQQTRKAALTDDRMHIAMRTIVRECRSHGD